MYISYGIIPIIKSEAGIKEYLLLKSHDGFWSFPKGHPQDNETPEETAIREAYEETGIPVKKTDLGLPVAYEYTQPIKGVLQTKRIVLFPVLVKSKVVYLQPEEIYSHEWATFNRAITLMNLPDIIDPLTQVENNSILFQ